MIGTMSFGTWPRHDDFDLDTNFDARFAASSYDWNNVLWNVATPRLAWNYSGFGDSWGTTSGFDTYPVHTDRIRTGRSSYSAYSKTSRSRYTSSKTRSWSWF